MANHHTGEKMAAATLQFKAVSKNFSGKPVLKGIDLAVSPGEFFAFVGANGTGKTTLIKGLLDFIQIDGGEIHLFGQSHRDTTSREHLAYLPERFTPPYFFTGRDFLKYMLRLHRRPFVEAEVRDIFQRLDLDPASQDKPVRTYSKGMTQKLGLAVCFLSQKKLLLLDEPMSGLDPKARVLLKRHLLHLKKAGLTLFFSTHLLADVEELCDRMAILHQGKIHYVGSPRGCRDRYPGATLEESFIHCIETTADQPRKVDVSPSR